jgi:hypothetical protein
MEKPAAMPALAIKDGRVKCLSSRQRPFVNEAFRRPRLSRQTTVRCRSMQVASTSSIGFCHQLFCEKISTSEYPA